MPEEITNAQHMMDEQVQYMLEQDAQIPIQAIAPPAVKLTAELLLGRSLLDLLKAAPGNKTVRTMISNHCRKTIPDALTDVRDIIQWIEENVTLPPPKLLEENPLWLIPDRPVGGGGENVVINMVLFRNGTESGRCLYTCSTHETYVARITREKFRELASEAESRENLITALEEYADEGFSENGGSEDSDNYDYDQHESEDHETDDDGWENKDQCEEVIANLLIDMRDSIDDDDDRAAFEEKFDL